MAATGIGCSGGGKGGAGGSGGTSTGSGGHTGAAGSGGVGQGGQTGGATGGVSANDGGSADAAACACFLQGSWKIANLEPCLVTLNGDAGASELAISTVSDGPMDEECPADFSAAPAAPWSTDTLTTDCVGHYRLCYAIKAGAGSNPQPNDCIVAQVCAEGDYTTANQPQTWPDLPGWISADSAMACAMSFTEIGGYGEKSVTGTATGCSSPIAAIIGIVNYCPLDCSDPNSPNCTNCMPGERDGGF